MASYKSPIIFKTLTQFLHPQRYTRPGGHPSLQTTTQHITRKAPTSQFSRYFSQTTSSLSSQLEPQSPSATHPAPNADPERLAHLNPSPSSYALTPFQDRCAIVVEAGAGGNGCVSFVREKFIPEGPPNGGDGGNGGNVFVQAVRGETSLHKLARRAVQKAGRGGNGKGSSRNGERGVDLLISVPVGTVIREVERRDQVEEDRMLVREERKRMRQLRREQRAEGELDAEVQAEADAEDRMALALTGRDRWVRYPGEMKAYDKHIGESPPPPARNRTNPLAAMQPRGRIRLDLDEPMERPMLLVAGGGGGLGNPNFITKDILRPKFATRGDPGVRLSLALELKVLADVGLVGLPNAGKSTLLRALTNSRTRIGDWAFTTLQPNIGTVVLDSHSGRPLIQAYEKSGAPRTSITIADIPGLIEDAHLDKGLGLGFLRHVERAAVLAFVIDLSARDAVEALKALWYEVSEYETLQSQALNAETESRVPATESSDQEDDLNEWPATQPLQPIPPTQPISAKPWFVVATKADLPETKENFAQLKTYVESLNAGEVEHPSGRKNAWRKRVKAIPVSAIRSEGVEAIPKLVIELLE